MPLLRSFLTAVLFVAGSAHAVEIAPAASAARSGVPTVFALPSTISPQGTVLDLSGTLSPSLPPALPAPSAPALTAPAVPAVAIAAEVLPVAAVVAAPVARVLRAAQVAPSKTEAALPSLSAAARPAASKADGPSATGESVKSAADAAFDGEAVRPAAEPVPGALTPAAPALSAASAPEAASPKGVPAPPRSPRRFVWPAVVGTVWIGWAAMMTAFGHWGLFAHNWFMSVTMAFGSFVAGATSEGSGSVSFPVMTLLFHIPPPVARDFALMIQSVGMTTAALTIFAMKIPVEKRVLIWGVLGGAVGMALGATFIAPLFAPAFAKMFFTSLWAAFAVSHFMAARRRGTAVESLGALGKRDIAAMLAFGVVGGVVSSIVGTGLCMVMFTLLTLGYRLSEKVATPTSVILMASNALFGFLWKGAVLGGMAAQAWNYWWVCVPIVVVGAPLGARFIAGRSRGFVTRILYAAIAIQLVAALLIVHQTPLLLATSAATFLIGAGIFRLMAKRGDAAAEKKA